MPSKKNPAPKPDAAVIAAHFAKPEHRFINRELSWLAFNTRVLEEAQNLQNPLLERVKFLSISAANLDEFTMVRVAGLMDQVDHGVHVPSADGLSPIHQLHLIHASVGKLIAAQQQCWIDVRKALAAEGVQVLPPEKLPKALSREDLAWLHGYFTANIFPLLTPIAVDPAHPFPFIPNLGMVQVLELSPPRRPGKKMVAMVPFPVAQPRFIELGVGKPMRLIALEEVIALCFEDLFPGFTLHHSGLFRIVRDSDLEIEDEADDLLRNLDIAVKKRRYGQVVLVKTNRGVSSQLLHFMLDHLPADQTDVIEVDGLVGLASLGALYALPRPDLKFPPFSVRFPERVNDYDGDCFAAIHAKDIIVHHPYESFDVVVQFLEQAAADPNVVSIKQTLYRTSQDSPIVKALIAAAENGKSVTAVVELKARFDEEANIRLARSMERAGVQVVYGFVEMKTHAKLSLVTRREHGTLRSYAHFGTGNYHPATAKVYTDLSYFTCDPSLCQDAGYVFNYITGYVKPVKFNKISVAPLNMRKHLIRHITAEIEFARAGQPASIWAKLNALVDEDIIDALYAASQAGVKIELVVRGICALKPGIPGFSENIRVRSMVGRFLEHARIYCFGNGAALPSPTARVFIGSADWMARNLDFRVETMVPIENATVHRQVLDKIMVANLKDERQSWLLAADGSYRRISDDPQSFAAHDYFMTNPSLSGRGKALAQMTAHAAMATPAPAGRTKKRGEKK
ncbi:MAG: RNA degradosome polyphosphate kinase [Alphaproteobacteria bacterium]|nr:RNA degradosome polyphosphate kinase [Alphaproteobacteria bacterium]